MKKWLFGPKFNDSKLLSQFFWANSRMSDIFKELGSFVGKKEPERCKDVVTQMRITQCHLLFLIEQMVRDIINQCEDECSTQKESSLLIFEDYILREHYLSHRIFRFKYPEEINLLPVSIDPVRNCLLVDDNLSMITNDNTLNNNLNLLLDSTHNIPTINLPIIHNVNDMNPSENCTDILFSRNRRCHSDNGRLDVPAPNLHENIRASFSPSREMPELEQVFRQIRDYYPPEDTNSSNHNVSSPQEYPGVALSSTLSSPLYPGFVWFVAEYLAVTPMIDPETGLQHPKEYKNLIVMAKRFVSSLECLRKHLREQAVLNPSRYSLKVIKTLIVFDRIFAQFEFKYISYMVPVKRTEEFEQIQCIVVLFSETLEKALLKGYLNEEQINDYDPIVMFSLPRLSIINGLLADHGPLSLASDNDRKDKPLSSIFHPFKNLLTKIRQFLNTLNPCEISSLELALCSLEDHHHLLPILVIPNKINDNTKISKNIIFDGQSRISKIIANTTFTATVSGRKFNRKNNRGYNSIIINTNNNNSRRPYRRTLYLPLSKKIRFNKFLKNSVSTKITTATNTNYKLIKRLPRNRRRCRSKKKYFYSSPPPDDDNDNELNRQNALPATPSNKIDTVKLLAAGELIHRLYICISGVADQMQTNFASDFRYILQTVFRMHENHKLHISHLLLPPDENKISKPAPQIDTFCTWRDHSPPLQAREVNLDQNNSPLDTFPHGLDLNADESRERPCIPQNSITLNHHIIASLPNRETNLGNEFPINNNPPPTWIPDKSCVDCQGCRYPFNVLRRRHHCRNCGNLFCWKCCSKFIPLPHYGIKESVRTCLKCFNSLRSCPPITIQ